MLDWVSWDDGVLTIPILTEWTLLHYPRRNLSRICSVGWTSSFCRVQMCLTLALYSIPVFTVQFTTTALLQLWVLTCGINGRRCVDDEILAYARTRWYPRGKREDTRAHTRDAARRGNRTGAAHSAFCIGRGAVEKKKGRAWMESSKLLRCSLAWAPRPVPSPRLGKNKEHARLDRDGVSGKRCSISGTKGWVLGWLVWLCVFFCSSCGFICISFSRSR